MRQFLKIHLLIFLLFPPQLLHAKKSNVSFGNIKNLIYKDYSNFYIPDNLKYLFIGICVAGVFANTNLDRDIQDWYQKSVRSDKTDRFSKVAKPIGNIYEPIGIYAGLAILGGLTKNTTFGSTTYEWSSRNLRSIVLGAPVIGLLQIALGASRPNEGDSRWRPFHDNNSASGHAFMGAIPFLVTANMVKPRLLKIASQLSSFSTGLSRINDNKHYFSQVTLGWLVAYLAVNSLDMEKKLQIEINSAYLSDGWKVMLSLPL